MKVGNIFKAAFRVAYYAKLVDEILKDFETLSESLQEHVKDDKLAELTVKIMRLRDKIQKLRDKLPV